MRKVKVLSLFDGISCGQVALEQLGFKVQKYFASEIEKDSIKVTQHNFSNTIQLGNVTKIKYKNGILYSENGNYKVGNIDLVIGGSPCQGFSYNGKKLNFEDKRSKLFFEYERLLSEIKPKYFLLENVKMSKESENIITNRLNVNPIEINSKWFSAQNRIRLYWTNIKLYNNIKDTNMYVKDIIDNSVNNYYYLKNFYTYKLNKEHKKEGFLIGDKRYDYLKYHFDSNKHINVDKPVLMCSVKNDTPSKISRQTDRVYSYLGKSPCLTKFNNNVKFAISNNFEDTRILNRNEYERLQTLPDDYTIPVKEEKAKGLIGDGWTVEVIKYILDHIPHRNTKKIEHKN